MDVGQGITSHNISRTTLYEHTNTNIFVHLKQIYMYNDVYNKSLFFCASDVLVPSNNKQLRDTDMQLELRTRVM